MKTPKTSFGAFVLSEMFSFRFQLPTLMDLAAVWLYFVLKMDVRPLFVHQPPRVLSRRRVSCVPLCSVSTSWAALDLWSVFSRAEPDPTLFFT